METNFQKEDLLKLARFLGLGFYRVTYKGQFVECDPKAKEIFGIKQDEADLTNYSIKDLYVVPAERDRRIGEAGTNECKPMSSTLSMRINGENKLLFDICWLDKSYQDHGTFVGLVREIENSTIFPKMFDAFPMGLYEIDDQNRVVRVNQKMVEILNYKNESEILGEDIETFYKDPNDLEEFSREIIEKGYAQGIIKLKDAHDKTIEVETFSQNINEFELARWGMLTDVTERERYIRTLEEMPTGYFRIEKEKVIRCNDHFAQLLGFENKKAAIGFNTRNSFKDEQAFEKYCKDLKEADKKNRVLQNYEIEIKRANDGKIITISVDSRLLKDDNGKVIGREGTIRDITERVELEKKVKETEERLEKTTADINKLIHTFLHPVLKFAGNSELLYQVGKTLYNTIQPGRHSIDDIKELGEKIETILTTLKDNLLDNALPTSYDGKKETLLQNGRLNPLVVGTLRDKLEEMIKVFDHSLKSEKSDILLDSDIRDTALWALEELDKIQYFQHDELKYLLEKEFVDLLQGILFNYIIRIARILEGETKIMKRKIEALRAYIGLKKERKYHFVKSDIGTILEENLKLFRPLLQEKNIEIRYNFSGNLTAKISPNDIDRVICNLLHNAKKYSERGKGRYVKVTAVGSKEKVEFSISSYGIPIKREEIESGKIFEFGTRSEFAYKSDRDGTGVGLADAKDVVEDHNGQLILTSKPSRDDSEPPEYKVPYVTKITISIPKYRKGGNNGS